MRWWLLLAVVLVGCGKSTPPAPKLPPSAFSPSLLVDLGLETAESARDPKLVLVGTDPSQARALLWSGQLGVNVGPYGTASGVDRVAQPAFRDGVYSPNEDIRPLRSPLDVSINANGKPIEPMRDGYWQSFDMRYGVLTTHWFAEVTDGFLEARLTSIVSNDAVRSWWEFQGPKGTQLELDPSKVLAYWPVTSHTLAPGKALDADRLLPRSGEGLSSGGRQVQTWKAPADRLTLESSGATWIFGSEPMLAIGGAMGAGPLPLKAHLRRQTGVLTGKSATEISIDGPLADQTAINSFMYFLWSERSGSYDTYESRAAARFSPFGLSSNRYNGHVFWDADVWLMPALAFIEPGVLGDYSTYRLSTLRDAPVAPFPWEDSLSGKETAPPEFTKEIHINGSVLWGLEFARALGVTVEWDVHKRGAKYYVQRATSRSNNNQPIDVVKRVADYYRSRATKRPDGKLGILDVMSPDESHIGPNDLYTNLVAQWAINGATWRGAANSGSTLFLPSDSKSFLTYENDPVRSYKQAAAVLSIYPLQYPPAEAQAKTMLERFQDKVTKNGPAMSDSIHATIWARLGDADKAYELWKKSWGDFVKGPFLLFSEKRSSPATYFTTGAAGCLQSVIYGFLGFRVDEQPEPGADWKLQLKNGRWLSIKPHLPSAWKSATFRNFHVLGRTYTLTVKRQGSKTVTSVSRGV
ncbi:MAG TPA: hypothetical protein VKT78_04080 [Fimbriimonadaceae bacterium]|nr:hypothetical protein [Fimbriimonadaceae bacterium]